MDLKQTELVSEFIEAIYSRRGNAA